MFLRRRDGHLDHEAAHGNGTSQMSGEIALCTPRILGVTAEIERRTIAA
jgi:hypothetical protein